MAENHVSATVECKDLAETSTSPPTPTTENDLGVGSLKSPAEESVASRTRSSTSKTSPIEAVDVDHGIIEVPKKMSPQQKNLNNIINIEHKFAEGYDSDGELPSFNIELTEGTQDFDEDAVFLTPTRPTTTNVEASEEPSVTHVHIPISEEEIKRLKLKDLRNELKKRLQPTHGKKAELIERLKDALVKQLPVVPLEEQQKKAKNLNSNYNNKNLCDLFAPTAYWEELFPLEDIVDEPENPNFSQPRAPTIEERDAAFIPVKHNFKEVFDRPVFKATKDVIELGRNNSIKYNRNKTVKRRTVARVDGGVNSTIQDKYQLSPKSLPTDYMEIFINYPT